MIKKLLLLALLTLAFISNSFGQNYNKLNTLYFELGGNGLFLSANYERQILKKTRLNFHIGTGIYGLKTSELTIPFGVNYLLRIQKSKTYLQFGFGATYTRADVKLYLIVDRNENYVHSTFINYVPSIGFRHQTDKNLMYRFNITPILNQYSGLPFFGLSIGKSF